MEEGIGLLETLLRVALCFSSSSAHTSRVGASVGASYCEHSGMCAIMGTLTTSVVHANTFCSLRMVSRVAVYVFVPVRCFEIPLGDDGDDGLYEKYWPQ